MYTVTIFSVQNSETSGRALVHRTAVGKELEKLGQLVMLLTCRHLHTGDKLDQYGLEGLLCVAIHNCKYSIPCQHKLTLWEVMLCFSSHNGRETFPGCLVYHPVKRAPTSYRAVTV